MMELNGWIVGAGRGRCYGIFGSQSSEEGINRSDTDPSLTLFYPWRWSICCGVVRFNPFFIPRVLVPLWLSTPITLVEMLLVVLVFAFGALAAMVVFIITQVMHRAVFYLAGYILR